jgi:hypothetical protein
MHVVNRHGVSVVLHFFAESIGKARETPRGPARAEKMTAEQRSASARKAVQARWAKTKKRESDV